MSFTDATPAAIDQAVQHAWQAFLVYRKTTWPQRAQLLYRIAEVLEPHEAALVGLAMEETHLPESRLRNEFARPSFNSGNMHMQWKRASGQHSGSTRLQPNPLLNPMYGKPMCHWGLWLFLAQAISLSPFLLRVEIRPAPWLQDVR